MGPGIQRCRNETGWSDLQKTLRPLLAAFRRSSAIWVTIFIVQIGLVDSGDYP
jgi:hypothetical protein